MKIAVIGYYGYQNMGDDALLDQTLQLLTDTYPDATLHILGANGQQHPHHRWVNRFGWDGLRAWRQADVAVFGGGGLFQDHTSLASLLYYVALVWLAKGRIIMLGQGFGRMRTTWGERLLRWTLPRAHWIGCRDAHSLQTAQQCLPPCHHHRLTLSADLAWGYLRHTLAPPPPWPPEGSLIMGWSLRPTNQNGHDWQSVLTQLGNQTGATHYGVACQPCDTPLLRNAGITKWSQGPFPHLSPTPHLMVAMRYHACVLAALHGIPFCALAYDDKVRALAHELGQPCLDIRHQQPHDVQPLIRQLLAHYQTYQVQLMTNRSHLYARWEQHAHVLRTLSRV